MAERTFMADEALLNDVTDYVEAELEEAGFSFKDILRMKVCLEEVFINVAHYAYGDTTGDVVIGIEHDTVNNQIVFSITDSGTPFNPLAKTDPDVTLALEERQIGGLGIFICKKIMDDILYNHIDGKNVLTMIKKI